jgi:two-component system sensor histidine kinase DesK
VNPGRGPGAERRLDWILGAVWLVFLAFPFYAVATADASPTVRGLGVAALVAFVVVYLRVLMLPDCAMTTGRSVSYLLLLAALTLPGCLIAGGAGLGTLPFIVAVAMFTLPVVGSVAVAVTAVTLPLVLPTLGVFEHGTEFYGGITAMVAVIVGMVRFVESREERHRHRERDHEIVAERERVARDVHDVLGHSLTVLAVKAELAERVLDVDPERAREELRQIQSLTRESIAEIRATVAGLRVARLSDELSAAREALAAAGIDADLPAGVETVDPRHRLVLAWALREAVTNVVRHSGARHCAVTFASKGMRVVDDGVGVAGAEEGNGLRGVRERVMAVGGMVQIGPGADGRGTSVEVAL